MTIFYHMHQWTTRTETQTTEIGVKIAQSLKNHDLIGLSGPLGAGKSVLARSIIRHLMQNAGLDVPSPTFSLVQLYQTPDFPLWHFDLYRLEDPDEIYEIGWEEALSDGIALIEWPERMDISMLKNVQMITLKPEGDNRIITYTGVIS